MTLSTTPPSVSLMAEIPEELNDALQQYLDRNPAWSQHRVLCAALSLFLMQNSPSDPQTLAAKGDRDISRIYLDALFDYVP